MRRVARQLGAVAQGRGCGQGGKRGQAVVNRGCPRGDSNCVPCWARQRANERDLVRVLYSNKASDSSDGSSSDVRTHEGPGGAELLPRGLTDARSRGLKRPIVNTLSTTASSPEARIGSGPRDAHCSGKRKATPGRRDLDASPELQARGPGCSNRDSGRSHAPATWSGLPRRESGAQPLKPLRWLTLPPCISDASHAALRFARPASTGTDVPPGQRQARR